MSDQWLIGDGLEHDKECQAVSNRLRIFVEKQWRQMRIIQEIERRRMVTYRAYWMGRRHFFEQEVIASEIA